MTRLTVRLSADSSAVDRAIATLLALAETGEAAAQLVERAIDAIEAGAETFVFETDRAAAAAADDVIVRAKATDRFANFVAAAGASHGDLVVVEQALAHFEASIGESDTADGTGGGEARPPARPPARTSPLKPADAPRLWTADQFVRLVQAATRRGDL